ncbi:MAG: hypothetical protein ACREV5_20650 [Steroidobacter sp.]
MNLAIIDRWPLALLVVAVLAGQGCSTQARRVDCDGRLTPINAPAPERSAVSAAGLTDPSNSLEKTDP